MARRARNSDGSKVERRKSNRFPVAVPIEVSWRGPDGKTIKEEAVARQVNAQGGLLEMSNYPEIGSRVSLTNFLSAEAAEARVLATPHAREGVSQGIVVELTVPSESFWGVNFQVKKTSVELQKLEQSLRAEGIDLRLLKEFREAMDYVRTAALMVQRLRELQLHGQDDGELLSSMSAERVGRAMALCADVIADIEAGRVNAETKGLDEFYRSLEQAYSRLKPLVKRSNSDRYVATTT